MNTSLETTGEQQEIAARADKRVKRKRTSIWVYLLLLVFWLSLIAGGLYEAKIYMENMKAQIETQVTTQVTQQTQKQLQDAQANYQKQIDELKSNVTTNMQSLQKKIDTFNQLLTFIKDSTNTKTNNSNQLYTQLAEVKQQLEQLKKNLDVLK